MSINVENDGVQSNANKPGQAFSGATLNEGAAAPRGSLDFVSMISRVGLTRIEPAIEPYLDKVREAIAQRLSGVEMIRLERVTNAFAFKFKSPDGIQNFFAIQFVSAADSVNPNFVPPSFKLGMIAEEIKMTYAAKDNIRLVGGRVIIAGYQADMDRWYEMANVIVSTFQVSCLPEYRDAKIDFLLGTEFSVSQNIMEARQIERALSPHGVAPRMDVAFVIKARIQNDLAPRELRDMDSEYRPLGVIGGYTEIREREVFNQNGMQVLKYRPVFNITVCNSVMPLEGIAAIMLAAIAPSIYNTQWWATQWSDLSEGRPNPGMLILDPDNKTRPLVLKDREELTEFVNEQFTQPTIAFQFQDGRDAIPGLARLKSEADAGSKQMLISRLTNFFDVADEQLGQFGLSERIEVRYDGVYGEPNGQLVDSRYIDYLYVAATSGVGAITDGSRRVLLGFTGDERDRARLTRQLSGETFSPIWNDSIEAINPDFIKWIVAKTEQRRLRIIDPNSHTETRTLGSVLTGFGQATNMGSIVTNGITSRGMGLQSGWTF